MKKLVIILSICIASSQTALAATINLDSYTPDIVTAINDGGNFGIRAKLNGPVRARSAGDYTGDGIADLLLAYPGKHLNGFSRAGALYVSPGKQQPTAHLSSDHLLVSGSADDVFHGTTSQYVGDVNSDGRTDFFATDASFNYTPTLYLTDDDGVTAIALQSNDDEPSYVALGQGDFNGDGNDDLIVSDTNQSIYVLAGPLAADFDGDIPTAALVTIQDDQSDLLYHTYGDEMESMAFQRVGDVNGDGFDDILVYQDRAPWNYNKADYLLLFLGSAEPAATLAAEDAGLIVNFHHRDHNDGDNDDYTMELLQAVLADINGDAKADIIVSTNDEVHTRDRDFVRILFGRTNLPATKDIFNAADTEFEGDQLGVGLTTGDLNGDGIGDLVVVADQGMRGPFYQYGLMYVFHGKRHWPATVGVDDAAITFNGGGVGYYGDIFIDANGDIDDDGKADLFIGTPTYRSAQASRSYILTSRDHDGDGFSETEGDCDDTLKKIHPGATDPDDETNNDCDQQTDEDATFSLLKNGVITSSEALSFHRTKIFFADGSKQIFHPSRHWHAGRDVTRVIADDGLVAVVRQQGGEYSHHIELYVTNGYTGETVAHKRIAKSGENPTGLSVVEKDGVTYLVVSFTAVEYYGPGYDIGATVRSYRLDLATGEATLLSTVQNTNMTDHTFTKADDGTITLTSLPRLKQQWHLQLSATGVLEVVE
ncbi:MAG: hypothetical protein HY565_04925 [Candidatus Kerfeldbacteria bacterium]|nr:hypothetical protein [Candidatus Kerfeldbacteria bacterium]